IKTKHIYLIVAVVGVLVVLRLIGNARRHGLEGFVDTECSFTMYYADWCPHCKAVKPDFEKFSKNGFIEVNGKKCTLAMVNDKEKDKIAGKPVEGYPTFLFEDASGKITPYEGERTIAGWEAFLKT